MLRGSGLVVRSVLRCAPRRLQSNDAALTSSSSPAKFEGFMDRYEDFIGIKAVKEAQAEVMHWEERLSDAQLVRRSKQGELKSIQARLKEIHGELDRTSRGEDRYLHLLTEEHAVIKQERALLEDFGDTESAEREAFHMLSQKVRASHERERERAEKTKWWGVSASLVGALLGIMGTSIGNELRMRHLQEMIPAGGAHMSEMAEMVRLQNQKVDAFIADMSGIVHVEGVKGAGGEGGGAASLIGEENVEKMMEAIRSENARLSSQMAELTRLARIEGKLHADPEAVVYVGNDMEKLLDQTERNLESRMKLQTLLSVVFLYTAIGVTIPLMYALFRGG